MTSTQFWSVGGTVTERARSNDPFDTEDREDLRAEQRRSLRQIDSWIINRSVSSYGLPDELEVDDAFRSLVEAEIRRWATNLLDETADLRRDIAVGLIAHHSQPVVYRGSFPPSLKPMLDEMRSSNRIDDLTVYDDEVIYKLHGVIYLLLLADVVAGDYTDPRIGPGLSAG